MPHQWCDTSCVTQHHFWNKLSDDGTPISQNNVLFTGQSVATEWQLDVDIKLTAVPTEYTNLLEVRQVGVVSTFSGRPIAYKISELRSWGALPSSVCSNKFSISSHLQFHWRHLEHMLQLWYNFLKRMAFTSYSTSETRSRNWAGLCLGCRSQLWNLDRRCQSLYYAKFKSTYIW